jgi:hypothetical protein
MFSKTLRKLLAGGIILCCSPTTAEAQYGSVLHQIRTGRFHEAENELRAISIGGCRAMAFYLLGYVNARLDDPADTIRHASRSLTCTPGLEQRYQNGSLELLSWAALRLAGQNTYIEFGFSEASERSRDLQKVAAQRELIDLAVRHVPGLRDEVEARTDNAESLNNIILCFGGIPSPACQDEAPPDAPLPDEE